jgi:hypothetical protein
MTVDPKTTGTSRCKSLLFWDDVVIVRGKGKEAG